MSYIPKVGEPLNNEDMAIILDALSARAKNFPDEPGAMTLNLILFNIGKRFTPLTCIEQEWTGYKKDISDPTDPKCPNGHPLELGKGITLGWVAEE